MSNSELIKSLLKDIVDGKDISLEDSKICAQGIIDGVVSPEVISALLVALRMKGESPQEIAGFAYKMIEKSLKPKISFEVFDTCGTGGDQAHTFNASTATAIILSSMGIPVAKHGNRAVSSSVGSADILEKIGVNINVKPEDVPKELEEKKFVFLFAPLYHPAMKNVAPIRREIGIRTIFNLLGPITNPARPQSQIIGVMSETIAEKISEAITILGSPKNALIVVGSLNENKKIDEVSICGETLFIEIKDSKVKSKYKVSPEEFGIEKSTAESIKYNGEPSREFLDVLRGKGRKELINFVCANAGAALFFKGKAKNLKEGFEKSKDFILSGKVIEHLRSLTKK